MKHLRMNFRPIAILGLLTVTLSVNASHHFEAADFLQDTRLAQVDNYIFPDQSHSYTNVIMTINYDPKPGENGIFSPKAVYNIHLASDVDLKAGKTISFKFNKNNYSVYESNNANPMPGDVGKKIGEGTIGKTHILANKMKVFVAPVKDAFFGNAISLEEFRKDNLDGKYNPKVWANANNKNVFDERSVGAIVVAIPDAMLSKDIYAFFTTDALKNKQYEQVQYSARPLFSHVMLFDSNILRKAHDQSRPTPHYNKDVVNLVSARILRGVSTAKTHGEDAVDYSDKAAQRLVPDVLSYKVGTETVYTPEEMNGRGLDDDIMSTMLSILLGENTDQKITNPKKHTDSFPYLMPTTLAN